MFQLVVSRMLKIILVTAVLLAVAWVTGVSPAFASIGNGRQEPSSEQFFASSLSLDELHSAAASAHILTRLDAVQRIAKRADPASREVLQTALSDPEPLVRRSTIAGLAAIGDAACVPALVAALKDEDPMVRHGAGIALSGFPSSETVRQLLVGLATQQPHSGRSGARRGGELGGGNSDPSEQSKRLEWGQSEMVISKKLLRQINASRPETTEILISKLADSDDRVRYAVAYALSLKSDPEITAKFNTALAGQDAAVVAGGYEFFMQRHVDSAKPFVLRGLREFNDADLAVSMSKSADADLATAAVEIARQKGVKLQARPPR